MSLPPKFSETSPASTNSPSIVNTSSWLSQGALRGSVLYSMTKAGLDAMTRALTFECADIGVQINNVAPGIVDTPMTSENTTAQMLSAFVDQTLIKRMTTPHEIAETAIWLCSLGASGVTGQTILVDGGYTIPGNRI
ncbi:SDR family oxidoreductase [Rhizobium ruizarguesonis]|uniref:SDR family NAD(P)-dependent oxidoreductase n=1 Tax=Rhizobium ruizarguesonis TaxID=2081791 RepID=UPI0010324E1D|nr:SDR family oxidoreductase [Rhizobium ruizarguesonis]TBE49910.1 SDR family oxidoreductase [Rhizobium ruizarguesonis]